MDNSLQKRETFGSQFGVVMSMAGLSIGLGNVWRFPYMVGEYGGGAFVLAYLVCVLVVVTPLAIVEVGFGKGTKKGLMDGFEKVFKNKTAGTVYGGISSCIYFSMNFFYILILGVVICFIFGSLTSIWNRMPAEAIYDHYYDNNILMTALLIALIAGISFVVYKGVSGGIEKVSKVIVPMIFLFFAVTIILSAILIPDIAKGYDYYLNPDFSVLTSFDIWVAAMGQALFSVGVGPGCLYIYGSRIKKDGDVTLTVMTIIALDVCVGLLAGMTIIPPCIALGMNPESGEQLIFNVLPAIFQKVPLAPLMGVIIFLAIFFAGLTSAIAQLEVAITTFSDRFNWWRGKTVLIFTAVTCLFAIPAVYFKWMLKFWSDFAGDYGFIITAGIGAICYVWIYGVKRIKEEAINPSSVIKLGGWFDPLVKFVATPIMILIMINSLFPFL